MNTTDHKKRYFEAIKPITDEIGKKGSGAFFCLSNISRATMFIGIKGGQFPGGTSSWGTQRTELNNIDIGVNNIGYYIHGGSSAGSAGCIDLTSQNDSFHSWFRSYGRPVDVLVNY